MKKSIFGISLLLVMLLAAGFATERADAFVLTASNFCGYIAYDSGGDVFGTFPVLDQRFSYYNTGNYYNSAGLIACDFDYNASNPTIEQVIANPDRIYGWELDITNIENPWTGGALTDVHAEGSASYNMVLDGATWLENAIGQYFQFSGDYIFEYSFTGPTTGTALLSIAANVDPGCFGQFLPPQYYGTFCDDLEATLTVHPTPEPVTLTMFGIGLAGIGVFRRKKILKK